MEKDNKVVLGAVLILLVGMLSFNFAGSLTGKVTEDDTEVTLSVDRNVVRFDPYTNEGNQPVYVTVTVHKGRIEPEVAFCKRRSDGSCGTQLENTALNACRDSVCTPQSKTEQKMFSVSRTLPEGDYVFRAEARRSSGETSKYFYSKPVRVEKPLQGYRDETDSPNRGYNN
ncbi:MAG: hypothetical protein AABW58_03435 [Nanoarchaeota archaeon]|mgnify:CR=1 FL=1